MNYTNHEKRKWKERVMADKNRLSFRIIRHNMCDDGEAGHAKDDRTIRKQPHYRFWTFTHRRYRHNLFMKRNSAYNHRRRLNAVCYW